MTAEEGASYGEQLIEAARRNNTDLFEDLQKETTDLAELINTATDPLGNYALHLAAFNGSYEMLDHLLDVEGVEVDPINRVYKDTPLHSAVRYAVNEPEHGAFLAEMLIDAGADPTIKNKDGKKAIDLADESNQQLIDILQGAELAREVPIEELDQPETMEGEDSGEESE
ncbi:uncharacterized protein SAPINGB_P002883 [Magnusiomyces paraingens]|uniref:Uncharacterized protein n=1 Tax=Magnusiomyces paraingens TaxID=2606893 RepID=A0A5E8BJQ2_9ASCO|nr:uncharacterized protein SAPINGB_P002883 [Saprochaete ingens]VVT50797.1 unnamed protein product [Saprochaete ingens]